MRIHLRGGKTAPRLLQDLSLYDPRKQPSAGFNILSQIPFHDEEKEPLQLPNGKGSCKHQWSMKGNQCSLPENGYKADVDLLWKIAAYCAACRSHLDLSLEFEDRLDDCMPCPTQDRPLHHFVHLPDLSKSRHPGTSLPKQDDDFAWMDTQVFQCSHFECASKLVIRFKPPRLIPDWVSQLTDQETIKNRAEKAIISDLARFEGHSVPRPMEVLINTETYINNAMYMERRRQIRRENKKWMLNLGDSCASMLEYMGFTNDEDGWMPPQPDVSSKVPFTNPVNIRLDDVDKELRVLMSKRPDDEKRAVKLQFITDSATKDLKGLLGCLDYQQSLRSRTIDLTKEEHPFYAGLGAVEDFHDDLISFAYDCQRKCDPENVPYYLECLQGIAEGRTSESLQTKVAIEASSGIISFQDVRAAYKELGLDSGVEYEDETILGTFLSRIGDAPKQESQLRRALKVVGQSRSSQQIEVIASQTVTNYQQALAFFDIESHTSDEFIPSIYSLKISETPSDKPTARHAISLIATHRNSNALRQFLETGTIGKVKMDDTLGYALLSIERPEDMDDATVLAVYQARIDEASNAHRLEELQEGLRAIATSRSSSLLKDYLSGGIETFELARPEWPVGLENIGNTCYLNSLLQCYFTIKPLRDLVLDIDNFLRDLNEENLRSKRVGSRFRSEEEVDRSQQFGRELRKLFINMIQSPRNPVRPEAKLVYLTLVSSKQEEKMHKNSLSKPTETIQIPSDSLPHVERVDQKDTEMLDDVEIDPKTSKAITGGPHRDDDSASPPTVVGDDVLMDSENYQQGSQARGLEDKENLPPIRISSEESLPGVDPFQSHESEQFGREDSVQENQNRSMDSHVDTGVASGQDHSIVNETSANAPHPERPPPVPPRPQTKEADLLRQAEETTRRQQDVTEAMGNVLDQLQCAIKAEAIDEDTNEQIDRIKGLFYGKQKIYLTDADGDIRIQESYMSDIKVYAKQGSLYSALDHAIYHPEVIDVGEGVGSSYTTISQLPPVLQIFVQRTAYSMAKGQYKVKDHLQLEETLYMDRYMDSSEKTDLHGRHRKVWAWEKDLDKLEKRRLKIITPNDQGMSEPEMFRTLLNYLQTLAELDEPITTTASTWETIRKRLKEIDEELEMLESRTENLKGAISSEFSDLQDVAYRLQSAFIHHGGADSGHYFIYIYDFAEKLWRKYNDGYVTEVKAEEVFAQDNSLNPATPYFLIYVKDDKKDELVNCVSRNPIQDKPKEDPDTGMEDNVDAAASNRAYGDNDANQNGAIRGWYSKETLQPSEPW